MTSRVRQQYDLYIHTASIRQLKAADVVLLEEGGVLVRFGFRYTAEYLEHPCCIALDPVQLPLQAAPIELLCQGGVPGILDDYLPDAWGKKVLARLAFYRDQQSLNPHSCIDMLSQLGDSRIGALQWVLSGQSPVYQLGSPLTKLDEAEQAAQAIDDATGVSSPLDEFSLLYLANAGTGVGGARPKALLYDHQGAYLAKFNRLHGDTYNNARVELACLLMAQAAGMDVSGGRVVSGINEREVLLLDRFDIASPFESSTTLPRKHLISVNSLLKDTHHQRDRGGVFRYDDIAQLVRHYSVDVERDLQHLLSMMLFNRAINNTDTHERNFSFVGVDKGYMLSPAYDMVPSLTLGEYPVAGFQYQPFPPYLDEAVRYGKIFGLPKTQVKQVVDRVYAAIERWPDFADQAGLHEVDKQNVSEKIKGCG